MTLMDTRPFLMVSPAYGRKYQDKAQALQEWITGKDFKILIGEDTGRLCSIRDSASLLKDGYTALSVRLEAPPYAGTIPLEQPE